MILPIGGGLSKLSLPVYTRVTTSRFRFRNHFDLVTSPLSARAKNQSVLTLLSKKKKKTRSTDGSPSQRPYHYERRWQGDWWWKPLLHNLPCSPSSYSSTYVTPIPSLTISSNRLIHPFALFSAWILPPILLLLVGAFFTPINVSPGRLVGVY